MNKPKIFLAVLDAVRPDHLSCYGYSKKTTPNIDKVASEGILFENAFSASAWTPPSHASNVGNFEILKRIVAEPLSNNYSGARGGLGNDSL